MRVLAGCVLGTIGGLWCGGLFHSSRKVYAKGASEAQPFSADEFRPFKLVHAYDESPNCKVLKFALPEGDMKPNLPIASCLILRYIDEKGKEISRPYTPISRRDAWGYFELLVKRYPNAKMASHLFSMKKGQSVDVKGPVEKITVKPNMWKTIGMIAAGTGINPMYQVARDILGDKDNKTEISLIYASRRKEDVLLGNELNELMELHSRFSPYFVLSAPPPNWMGGIGHVTKEMIKAFMPPPSKAPESIVLVCGPRGFLGHICGDKDRSSKPPKQGEIKGLMKELGYASKQVYKF